uniref:HAUS augmin-like complex, subunit 5 n=1 Tax=Oryzias latipes TaxID=8090 RepID=A0A3P9J491_ORYLA
MSDKNLVDELRRWATEEFNLPPDSLPNNNYLKTWVCQRPNASFFSIFINYIFDLSSSLFSCIKCHRLPFQTVCWEWQVNMEVHDPARLLTKVSLRRELQTKIEQLRSEVIVVDSQIRGTEEQLATQGSSNPLDSQCRELILQAFRQRCSLGRQILSDDVKKIDEEKKVHFKFKWGLFLSSECVFLQQRELRALCVDRVQFYQSLQESELKLLNSANRHMTREQRTTVYQYWLSSVEKVLGDYPPNHVLSALQYLAFREQTELEKKLVSADSCASFRFQYESNRLLDVSLEERNELPPVKTLLEAAWEDVQQSQVELAQTRCRVQGLKQQLVARKKETAAADESALEVELQGVMQAAALDHIRDFCIQLDRHAKSRQEALRSLHSQWQSILDFRELVALRQEQIRGLIRGNSTGKTQLIRLHKELQEFIEGEVLPQFADVINAATDLRNSISKEARQFGSVSLVSLDRRVVDGIRRVPASSLSIHRLASPNFSSLCQNLSFPVHKAPEGLCSQARYLQLDFRFLRRLLQLYTTSLQNVQTEAEQLHASDQKALLNRIKEEDQRILKSLLPRARGLTQGCAQALSYRDQFQTAISHWWDKPAQHVLPEVSKGGLTFQQWLQRWKLAAKDL